MKKRILLVDPSLTVQKVVSLTLDHSLYHVSFAKGRSDVLKLIGDQLPDLLIVSDQVSDLDIGAFPKEFETLIGRLHKIPPMVLITSNEEGGSVTEQKNYQAVLSKPFSPQQLKDIVAIQLPTAGDATSRGIEREAQAFKEELADTHLEKAFNDAFADEAALVRQTLNPGTIQNTDRKPNAPSEPSLWGSNAADIAKGLTMDVKKDAEQQIEQNLQGTDLSSIIDRALSKMVPPIVEKMVKERLDKLLNEQEQFVEVK